MDAPVLGVDVGGSKIRVTVQQPPGVIVATVQVATPAEGGGHVVDAIGEAVDALAVTAAACGVGTAGDIEPETGRVAWASATIRDWSGFPLGERLRDRLGVPVTVENDGNAATAGEHLFGAAHGTASSLGVFVGTGIGGGIVLDGRLLRGARHRAAEIGHTDAASAAGAICPCGETGHIEAVASAFAVERDYATQTGGNRVSYAEVSARAERGDAVARALLHRAGEALALWLPSMVAVLDPDMIVVGGGAIASATWWAGFTGGLADPRVTRATLPGISRAFLGGDAVAIGAAALAGGLLTRGPRPTAVPG